MASSQPFLNPVSVDHGCYICGIGIPVSGLRRNGVKYKADIETIRKHALAWKTLNVPENDSYISFVSAFDRMTGKNSGYFHENCITNLRIKSSKYSQVSDDGTNVSIENLSESSQESCPSSGTRSTRSALSGSTEKRDCFICNQIKDENTFRITQVSIAEQFKEAMTRHIKNPNSMHHLSAKRLDLTLQVVDIFAADVFYHKWCKHSFTYEKKNNELDPAVEFVRAHFQNYIELKINKQKNAYLLHELLKDAIGFSDDYGVESIYNNTRSLRRFLEEKCNNLGFYKLGKHVLVYASDVDPIMYCESALEGHGLRKNDIARAFAKMIHRVADDYADSNHIIWPATVDELIESYASDKPIVELYNVIYMTIHRQWTSSVPLNESGMAKVPSKNMATKIWSLACDWTALITGLKNSKQITLALDIHRLTANKEVGNLLWKAGHAISPNDVRVQNEEFVSSQNHLGGVLSGLERGTPTHSSLDNNDQCQDTSTGKNTTHHTNFLIFQPNAPKGIDTVTTNTNRSTEVSKTEVQYKIGKLVPPSRIPNYEDNEGCELLERCFLEDILWSLTSGVPSNSDNPLPLLGSWTAYKRATVDKVATRSLLNYLPANENPPEHGVCKEYLEYLMEVMGCLDIKRIFVHADEQVYARIVQLIWKYKEKFKNIIPLMGGFHQLRVFQRIIYKRHAVIGYGDWYSDAGVIAEGSTAAAIEGRHYYRSMRVHKEGFDALTQYRFEDITNSYENIDQNLLGKLKELRRKPCRALIDDILASDSFQQLHKEFITVADTRAEMTMQYLRDVSLMLSIVSAVREGCFERHLQAERQFLKLVFAFDHVNYARYNTYQHIFLTNMNNNNDEAVMDLKTHGFGCTTSDAGRFAAKHGDLETEHFNRETKGTAGPFRSGYSTNIHAVNRWIKTSHCHAKLRKAVKSQFRIFTSSVHKEMTPKNKKLHFDHVNALKKKLREYNSEPFKPGPARNLVTGREIDQTIIRGLLDAPETGNRQLKTFVNNVFVAGTKKIFDKISQNKINTGMEEKKKTCKTVDVLQEDKKAFGLIISKCQSKEEGFSYPMTYYPLSIAKSEEFLYSSDKAKFRNLVIGESLSVEAVTNAVWIVDAGYAIRQVPPKNTYHEYFVDMLTWMLPDPVCLPQKLVICIDVYRQKSTKDGERKERRGGKEEGKRVHVTGLQQIMPKGRTKWADFLSNGENKNDLMNRFEDFLLTDAARTKLNGLELVFCGEKVWSKIGGNITEIGSCNHEEADTKIPLFACQSEQSVVAVASDCDVLILLVSMYAKRKPKFQWQMKYESGKFANIQDICSCLGYAVAPYLAHFHGISGCDDVSYFYGKGKTAPFKKALNGCLLELLSGLGHARDLSREDIEKCKEFVRQVIYPGNSGETYVETRINLYDKQPPKNKTTMTIPPDEDSCTQHILRCHHRLYIWIHCDEYTIPDIDPFKNGWKLSDSGMVVPIWYVGPQLPPSCKKSTRKKTRGGYEADGELDRDENPPRNRKRKQKAAVNDAEDDMEDIEKKRKRAEMAIKFRSNRQKIAEAESSVESCSDNEDPNNFGDFNTTDYNPSNDEDSIEGTDDSAWEHLSEFDFDSDSSGSDWM